MFCAHRKPINDISIKIIDSFFNSGWVNKWIHRKNDDLHQVLGCLLGINRWISPRWRIHNAFPVELDLPSGKQMWMAGKSPIGEWWISHYCSPLLKKNIFTMDFPPFISGRDHSGYGISHWPIATSSGSPKHISSCALHHSASKGDRTASTMGFPHGRK